MRVTLFCGHDDLTVWFAAPSGPVREVPIVQFPNVCLIFDNRKVLKGVRLLEIGELCPYERLKVVRSHAPGTVEGQFLATYDPSCDMGYVYLDRRGPGSVDDTVATDYGVNVDISKDKAVLGFEDFSPSHVLPELVQGGDIL